MNIDKIALRKLSEAIDCFVGECINADGSPKSPSSKDIAKIRGYLPPYCKMAYKKKPPIADAV